MSLIIIVVIFSSGIFLFANAASRPQSIDPKFDIGYTCTIFKDNKPKCSGTLISRMWAITTCLCVRNIPANHLSVRTGDPHLRGQNKHKFYKANVVEVHPQCMTPDKKYNSEHDLALILLKEPLLDSRYVYIVKIPRQLTYWTPDSSLGMNLAVYTDLKDLAGNIKQAVWQATSLLLHPGICIKHLKVENYKVGKNICASYFHRTGTNNCELDTGASLCYDYTLIGILVQKDKCGKGQGVGSYVNVPLHSEWIRQTTYKHTDWISL